jgi:hypothetical protein
VLGNSTAVNAAPNGIAKITIARIRAVKYFIVDLLDKVVMEKNY